MSDDITAMQYLTFTLDREQFAVGISSVREVLEFTSATKVPRTPDFMRGVINLRGTVVPVIDLRLKLGLSRTETTIDTCVVILEVEAQGETLVMGALADSVQEVIELEQRNIEPPPRMGTRVNIDFIRGIGKRDERFVMVLDISKVLTDQELRGVTAGSAGSDPALLASLAAPTAAAAELR
jgi:purine-binding chemotaxis protein CheW